MSINNAGPYRTKAECLDDIINHLDAELFNERLDHRLADQENHRLQVEIQHCSRQRLLLGALATVLGFSCVITLLVNQQIKHEIHNAPSLCLDVFEIRIPEQPSFSCPAGTRIGVMDLMGERDEPMVGVYCTCLDSHDDK